MKDEKHEPPKADSEQHRTISEIDADYTRECTTLGDRVARKLKLQMMAGELENEIESLHRACLNLIDENTRTRESFAIKQREFLGHTESEEHA